MNMGDDYICFNLCAGNKCLGPASIASSSVAEWSKEQVLGTSLFGGVGSNPTAAKFPFWIVRTLVVYSLIKTPIYAIQGHRHLPLIFNQNMFASRLDNILQYMQYALR